MMKNGSFWRFARRGRILPGKPKIARQILSSLGMKPWRGDAGYEGISVEILEGDTIWPDLCYLKT